MKNTDESKRTRAFTDLALSFLPLALTVGFLAEGVPIHWFISLTLAACVALQGVQIWLLKKMLQVEKAQNDE